MPVTLHPASESVIFAALRSGDVRRAVELLLDTYQDELFGYCARLVGVQAATDVYQRVLGAAVDDLPAVEQQVSLRAWLFRIARNTVTHHHRTDRQQHPQAVQLDYAPVEGPADLLAARLHPDPALEQRLSQLDSPLREVLHLSLWHGLRLSEIAHVTGHTAADVRAMAARALARLALELQRSDSPS